MSSLFRIIERDLHDHAQGNGLNAAWTLEDIYKSFHASYSDSVGNIAELASFFAKLSDRHYLGDSRISWSLDMFGSFSQCIFHFGKDVIDYYLQNQYSAVLSITTHHSNRLGIDICCFYLIRSEENTTLLAAGLLTKFSSKRCKWVLQHFVKAFRIIPRVLVCESHPSLVRAIKDDWTESKCTFSASPFGKIDKFTVGDLFRILETQASLNHIETCGNEQIWRKMFGIRAPHLQLDDIELVHQLAVKSFDDDHLQFVTSFWDGDRSLLGAFLYFRCTDIMFEISMSDLHDPFPGVVSLSVLRSLRYDLELLVWSMQSPDSKTHVIAAGLAVDNSADTFHWLLRRFQSAFAAPPLFLVHAPFPPLDEPLARWRALGTELLRCPSPLGSLAGVTLADLHRDLWLFASTHAVRPDWTLHDLCRDLAPDGSGPADPDSPLGRIAAAAPRARAAFEFDARGELLHGILPVAGPGAWRELSAAAAAVPVPSHAANPTGLRLTALLLVGRDGAPRVAAVALAAESLSDADADACARGALRRFCGMFGRAQPPDTAVCHPRLAHAVRSEWPAAATLVCAHPAGRRRGTSVEDLHRALWAHARTRGIAETWAPEHLRRALGAPDGAGAMDRGDLAGLLAARPDEGGGGGAGTGGVAWGRDGEGLSRLVLRLPVSDRRARGQAYGAARVAAVTWQALGALGMRLLCLSVALDDGAAVPVAAALLRDEAAGEAHAWLLDRFADALGGPPGVLLCEPLPALEQAARARWPAVPLLASRRPLGPCAGEEPCAGDVHRLIWSFAHAHAVAGVPDPAALRRSLAALPPRVPAGGATLAATVAARGGGDSDDAEEVEVGDGVAMVAGGRAALEAYGVGGACVTCAHVAGFGARRLGRLRVHVLVTCAPTGRARLAAVALSRDPSAEGWRATLAALAAGAGAAPRALISRPEPALMRAMRAEWPRAVHVPSPWPDFPAAAAAAAPPGQEAVADGFGGGAGGGLGSGAAWAEFHSAWLAQGGPARPGPAGPVDGGGDGERGSVSGGGSRPGGGVAEALEGVRLESAFGRVAAGRLGVAAGP